MKKILEKFFNLKNNFLTNNNVFPKIFLSIEELVNVVSDKSILFYSPFNGVNYFIELLKTKLNIQKTIPINESIKEKTVEVLRKFKNFNFFIALGGGRTIDFVKYLKFLDKNKIIITIPTTFSTCAALTTHSVFNTEFGAYFETSPSFKAVDFCLINKKFFKFVNYKHYEAGILDAVSKYFEINLWQTKDKIEKIGLEIFHNLSEKNLSLENLIYNCILLPSIYSFYPNSPTANIAHAVGDALSYFYPNIMHGTRVGFGIDFLIKYLQYLNFDKINVELFHKNWNDFLNEFSFNTNISNLFINNKSYFVKHILSKKSTFFHTPIPNEDKKFLVDNLEFFVNSI